jgi:hypothetical protein
MAVVDSHGFGFGGAKEAPEGLTEAFGFDVPEGDIDGGEGGLEDGSFAVAGEFVIVAVPVVFDAAGVLALEVWGEPLDGLFDDFNASGDGAFAEAGDALAGLDFQEEVVAVADGVLARDEPADGEARRGREGGGREEERAPGERGGHRCGLAGEAGGNWAWRFL